MNISTEEINLDTKNIDLLETFDILKLINNEDKKIALAVESELIKISEAVDIIYTNFKKGGRLLYFGAGTSGRLGVLDASECPPTFGVADNMVIGTIAGGKDALIYAIEGAEDNEFFAISDYNKLNINSNDTVVCISASGNPKYLLKIAQLSKNNNVKVISVTSNKKAKLKDLSSVFISVNVGPEVISGSSRMKSGTAQKMILNMLSTASMIKLGKTYENLMVDLKPTNEKLKNRSLKIVMSVTNCSEEVASNHLKNNGYDVKLSIVEILMQVSTTEAISLLENNNNILRKTIAF